MQLMSPIGTAGLFRATMIHTMNALRENSDLLLSTMDVFIKEPLMEWMVSVSGLFSPIYSFVFFINRNMHLKQANKFPKAVGLIKLKEIITFCFRIKCNPFG
jgi:phosphatidylinositol kinase/protein kinase (PI-3  family)